MTKITAKGDRYYQVRQNLLENVTVLQNMTRGYYKVWKVVQSVKIIIKLDVTVLIYWKQIHLKLLLLRRLR